MDVRALVLGLVFAFIWSSAFSSGRIIVEAAPPLSALSLRFYISGLLAVGIAVALGQTFRLSRSQWRAVLVFGVSQNAIYLGLNFVAMQTVEASLAAIIASALPLLVAATNWSLFGERLPVMGLVGLVAGFAGVAIIMAARFEGGADLTGVILCLVALVALTVATLSVRTAASDGANLLMVIGLQMLAGATALVPPAIVMEAATFRVYWSWQLVAAFVYTTIMPGLTATFIWFRLVGRIGPTRAATFHFLTPFFGVAVAAILLGERLTMADAVG
ncbi:DMT family transporter, partial [Roseicyclus sp.]|uniref:DMT family transporter n=1 Tax=Roseicyclus sp. TaxID=1914329 RepID=UPI003FA137EF